MMAAPAEPRWYVVHTQPNAEMKAAARLEEQGFRTFFPRFRTSRRHARRTDMVVRPVFPRYLFVWLDIGLQRWRSVNGTIGVVSLVGASDRPTPVPRGVVEALHSSRDEAGFLEVRPKHRFRPGEAVRIVGGAFASALGVFEKMDARDRVSILLNMLGREFSISLDQGLVEKVD